MKLFLSHSNSGEVKGGVELYSSHLQKVFPDLKTLDYHSLKEEFGDTFIPLLREPWRAEQLGKKISKEFSTAEILTNGMFSWNLMHKKQVNICHGTYAEFAEKAVSKTNPDYYRLKYIYSAYEKKAANNAKIVVANSKNTAFNIKKHFGLDSKVIYPAVDFSEFILFEKEKAQNKLNWSGVNVIFVGRPEYAKGFDFIEQLALKNPQIQFRCVLSRKYDSKIKNLHIIEPIAHSKLSLYYSAADIVLFPSRFEGFGFVTIEALACNKKIIALNTGVASEIFSENIFIAEPNIKSIQNKISMALDSEETKSRNFIKNNFSFTRFEKEWLELDQLITDS